jgi:hypothetical protein
LPEALARADYDFTVSEDAPSRRRTPRARGQGRIEPTVSRVPQMRDAAGSQDAPIFVRALRPLIRRPLRTLFTLACGAIVVSFFSNLLFMQEGPHPAPLFVKQEAKPAETSQPRRADAGAPPAAAPAIASAPAQPAVEARAPLPPPAARSAPPSIVTAAPVKPAEPPKPAAKQPDFDPIAQFLRNGVVSAPTTTASTSAPPAADARRVTAAQRALAKLGHKLDADGLMGPGTRAAIQKFERDNKLPVTGELNPRTLKTLSARASIPIP